jgi:serpin B
MKKFTLLSVSLVIAVSVLAACALPEPTNAPIVQGTPISGAKVPNTEEPVKTIAVPQTTPQPSKQSSTLEPANPTSIPVVNATAGQELKGGMVYISNPKVSNDELKSLAEAQNGFAVDLYKQLAAQPGNLFFSPYSLFSALTMSFAGAKGATAGEMIQTRHLPYTSEKIHEVMNGLTQRLLSAAKVGDIELFKFTIANAVWVQAGYPFLQSYLDTLSANYAAGLRVVDFRDSAEASKLINTWVSEQTNERIQQLIQKEALTPATRLVLTNAIYFKANWASQFKEKDTADAPFYLQDESSQTVKMMYQQANFAYLRNQQFDAVDLPYEGGNFSMLLLMPKGKSLNEFEKDLTPEILNIFTDSKPSAKIDLYVPKFGMEQSFSLNETLQKLGMKSAFEDTADFSGMTGSKDLKISDVVHKAFLQVNESGTEAAAATGVVIGLTSAMPPEDIIELRFDHPFLLMIRDNNTGTLVFLGRYLQP